MDACLGGLIWYLFGFGLAYDDGDGPGNPFIGSSSFNFALSGVDDSAGDDNGTPRRERSHHSAG
jgi:ammonia channel protein AmtB